MMEVFLPEWAPNLHPLIIHFPIVLLVVAVFTSFVEVILAKEWIYRSRISLYILGTLSALVTVLTGRQAADSVSPPFSAEITMSKHSDMGHYTLYFFIALTLAQLLVLRYGKSNKIVVKILLLIAGMGGLILLFQTGDLGAKLVYKYGVGINQ